MARNRNRSTNPQPAKSQQSASSNQPPGEYRRIVHSIDALKEEIATANKTNDTHQKDALWWNKRAALLIGAYTLLTAVLVVLNKYSVDATRPEGFKATPGPLHLDENLRILPNPALCPHWNCADDECVKDKERYDDESKSRGPTK